MSQLCAHQYMHALYGVEPKAVHDAGTRASTEEFQQCGTIIHRHPVADLEESIINVADAFYIPGVAHL